MECYSKEDLFSTIKELEIIDDSLLEEIFSECKKSGADFDDTLIHRDLISDSSIGKIIGDLIKVKFINILETPIEDRALDLIPKTTAQYYSVIAFKIDSESVYITTSNPFNTQLVDFLEKKTGLEIKVFYSPTYSIKKSLAIYSKEVLDSFKKVIEDSIKTLEKDNNSGPPIIKIVDTIIDYAYQNSASDIHIEPLEDESLVRFRIDGVLHDILKFPTSLHAQVVTRVKVLADLRTDEHLEAQDGKISFETSTENLDIRVSIAPITKGEKIVMRLLSEKSRQFSLSDLGLDAKDLEKIVKAYKAPHGLVLATGPTGSGKTTTLYSILKLINKRGINIMTIEDPVEYQIENVNQIQVNNKTNLTFAKGLRSIVRQDPDVILVGEIRDNETADIAINSAMTGHLVLSTLHTNDSVTSFPRLIDMEVEPYLVASTVNIVIAQRLVRKICPRCRVSHDIPYSEIVPEIKKFLPRNKKLSTYLGKGCDLCHHTGYLGRIGIFEVLEMNEELADAIGKKMNSQQLREIAIKTGMRTMIEDGIEKIKQGVTTVDELLKVAKE